MLFEFQLISQKDDTLVHSFILSKSAVYDEEIHNWGRAEFITIKVRFIHILYGIYGC